MNKFIVRIGVLTLFALLEINAADAQSQKAKTFDLYGNAKNSKVLSPQQTTIYHENVDLLRNVLREEYGTKDSF
ncbi:hypothetical protein [Sphingobacterium detergens]|uniref:hypothetical protein n=1 Tax=Sphingobacterium detergens TaxID=1145106 RepID=UPI003AAB6103